MFVPLHASGVFISRLNLLHFTFASRQENGTFGTLIRLFPQTCHGQIVLVSRDLCNRWLFAIFNSCWICFFSSVNSCVRQVLCYAMLCYTMPCWAMLWYTLLCYAVLCYDSLFRAVQWIAFFARLISYSNMGYPLVWELVISELNYLTCTVLVYAKTTIHLSVGG